MRRLILSLCLYLSVIGVSQAQTLVVTKGGYYWLSLDGSGRPTLMPVPQVVTLDGGPTVPPPSPPPTSSLRTKAKTLAIATGDPTGIMALSSVYSIVADKVNSGEIDHTRSLAATVQLTDAVLGSLGTAQKWTAWRSGISADIILLQQQGKLSTKAEYVAVLKDVAGGLEDASKTSGILDNINWENLFKLIMFILELLKAFK